MPAVTQRLTKSDKRVEIATQWIIDTYGVNSLNEMTPAELIDAMLKFSEQHIAWKTAAQVGAIYGHGKLRGPDAEENQREHHKLQTAFHQGMKKTGVGQKISYGFYKLTGAPPPRRRAVRQDNGPSPEV